MVPLLPLLWVSHIVWNIIFFFFVLLPPLLPTLLPIRCGKGQGVHPPHFTLYFQFLLMLNYLFHILPPMAILFLHKHKCKTCVFIYFPETQSHQAVGLKLWVDILGYEGIISQHSMANNVNIRHLRSLPVLATNQHLFSGPSS